MSLPLLKIAAKKHVIKFLSKKLSTSSDHNHPIIPARGLLIDIIRANLTEDFFKRMEQVPEKLSTLEVLMPVPFREFYIHQKYVQYLASSLEDYFWSEFQLYVASAKGYESLFMDDAIKRFMDEYQIYESDYSIWNFRRRLNRRGEKGLDRKKPLKPERLPKVKHYDQLKIYRLRRYEKYSWRSLANIYGVDRKTVKKIYEKISLTMSKESHPSPTPEHQ